MTITTKFNLLDHVKIIPLDDTEGRVVAIKYFPIGLIYLVTWFVDGKLHEDWLWEDELKAMDRY